MNVVFRIEQGLFNKVERECFLLSISKEEFIHNIIKKYKDWKIPKTGIFIKNYINASACFKSIYNERWDLRIEFPLPLGEELKNKIETNECMYVYYLELILNDYFLVNGCKIIGVRKLISILRSKENYQIDEKDGERAYVDLFYRAAEAGDRAATYYLMECEKDEFAKEWEATI